MEYPREYRLKWGWRYLFMAVCMLLAGAMLAIPLLFADEDGVTGGALWLICSPMVLLGLVGAISLQRSRVILHADAIESQGLLRRKRLARVDIEGRKMLNVQHGPPQTRLVSRNELAGAIDLPQYLETDAVLQSWVAAIADLDAQQRAHSERAYLGEPTDQVTRNEKLQRLRSATRVARIANGATLMLCGWAWFYPHPYLLVVGLLAIVPVIAVLVAAMGKGAYSLEGRDNDIRASLALPFFMPGLVLTVRALLDISVLDSGRLFWLTVGAAATCMLLVLWVARELRQTSWVGFILPLITMSYCYGAASVVNLHLDDSEPQVFVTRVVDMRVSSGNPITRYLKVEPWGPANEADELEVGKELYKRVRKGDSVCVYLFPGALGVRWLEVWSCPA